MNQRSNIPLNPISNTIPIPIPNTLSNPNNQKKKNNVTNTPTTAVPPPPVPSPNNMTNTFQQWDKLPYHKPFNTMSQILFPDIKSKWKIRNNLLIWQVPLKMPPKYIRNFDIMLQIMNSDSVYSPIDVIDREDKRYLVFPYQYKMSTLKDAILYKQIRSHSTLHSIIRNIITSYAKLNEKYGFRMFDLSPDHILIDENMNVYWFGFLMTETNEYTLSKINKLSQVFKTNFDFTNKLVVRFNPSLLNIFTTNKNKNKNAILKLSSDMIDIIRLLRFFNAAEKLLFLDNNMVRLNGEAIRVINSNNMPIYEKLGYLAEHFTDIFEYSRNSRNSRVS